MHYRNPLTVLGYEAELMRKNIYSIAMSLDGYIAGPIGDADWIIMNPEIDFDPMMARFDTILMGRQTFEATHAAKSVDPD